MDLELRSRARKNHPKSPEFEIGTMVVFVRTYSYGDGTWTTVTIRGDKHEMVVVRC